MNNQTVTLTLKQEHLIALNKAIVLGPYGEMAPLINEINRQISEQMNPPAPLEE